MATTTSARRDKLMPRSCRATWAGATRSAAREAAASGFSRTSAEQRTIDRRVVEASVRHTAQADGRDARHRPLAACRKKAARRPFLPQRGKQFMHTNSRSLPALFLLLASVALAAPAAAAPAECTLSKTIKV